MNTLKLLHHIIDSQYGMETKYIDITRNTARKELSASLTQHEQWLAQAIKQKNYRAINDLEFQISQIQKRLQTLVA